LSTLGEAPAGNPLPKWQPTFPVGADPPEADRKSSLSMMGPQRPARKIT